MKLAQQLEANSYGLPQQDASNQTSLEELSLLRQRQNREFSTLLDNVCSLPGLEQFMLPDKANTLVAAASDGPVVALVSSTISCNALIAMPDGVIKSVAFPNSTQDWIAASVSQWRRSIDAGRKIRQRQRKAMQSQIR